MRPLHEQLATRLLHRLAEALFRHPWLFVAPQLVLAAACIAWTVTHLQFSTSRADLISAQVKHQQDFIEFKREFRFPESLVAMVESGDQERNRRFIERLALRLSQEPDLFSDTYYKGDLRLLGPKALLFLGEETLEDLRRALDENWSFIETLSQADSLNSLVEAVNRQFRQAGQLEALHSERLRQALPGLGRLLDDAAQSLVKPQPHPSPGIAALFGDQSRLYVTFASGQMYVLVTHPAASELEGEAIRRLRELSRATQNEFPGVNTGITGEPVLNLDEMTQARRDISLAAGISVVCVAVIFILGYREIRRPLLATVCLLVGISYTLGFATLAVGSLNILSITLVPILIGLAIDFGIHLITRYEEELRKGRNQRSALRTALVYTGTGILTSGFTIAGAFFAMLLTDFKGIQEMGLIAGAGLLLCLAPMMTLLPLLLARGRPEAPDTVEMRRRSNHRARVEQVWLRRPRLVLWGGLALALLAISQFPKLHFDYNLLNLQSRDLPAVGVEERLVRSGSQSLLFGVVVADSLEAAVELEERIRALPPVAGVSSMVGYLTEDQQRKLELVREIQKLPASLRLPEPDGGPVEVELLSRSLFSLQGFLGWAAEELEGEGPDPALAPELRAVRESVSRLRSLILASPTRAAPRLSAFQAGLFGNFHETVAMIGEQDARERLRAEDLPRFLRERFVSPSGKFLLQVYAQEDVWQRPKQEEFVEALRALDPDVTGTVVQIYEYTSMLKENFQKATAYAAGIIVLLVLSHFRRPGPVLLAFLPVLLGFCWMLGLMGLFGIPFNPVNVMALTLIVGIGMTNGIHILNRFAEDPCPEILAKSTGKAVLVSAFTSMAGFGSLMSAKHHGIATLGEVMVIGTGMCMVAALTVLPAMLHLLSRGGWNLLGRNQPARVHPGRAPRDAGAPLEVDR